MSKSARGAARPSGTDTSGAVSRASRYFSVVGLPACRGVRAKVDVNIRRSLNKKSLNKEDSAKSRDLRFALDIREICEFCVSLAGRLAAVERASCI